jgi:predicted ATPase
MRQFKDAQFIISTRSPVLLSYPEAQILSIDEGEVREIEYERTGSFQVVHHFLNNRKRFLRELLTDPPSLFDEE